MSRIWFFGSYLHLLNMVLPSLTLLFQSPIIMVLMLPTPSSSMITFISLISIPLWLIWLIDVCNEDVYWLSTQLNCRYPITLGCYHMNAACDIVPKNYCYSSVCPLSSWVNGNKLLWSNLSMSYYIYFDPLISRLNMVQYNDTLPSAKSHLLNLCS